MADSKRAGAPLKRRRVTRACDWCHRGGVKCVPGPTPESCQPCLSFGSTCTYDRPMKRRGPQARSIPKNVTFIPQVQHSSNFATQGASPEWVYQEVTNYRIIEDLVEIYHRVVYPIVLYFHWPVFSADIRSKRYTRDRSFFTLTMAVCATASARIRDGAHLPPSSSTVDRTATPSSEVFYRACLDSIPVLMVGKADFNFMRTEGLLGMLCLQYNDQAGCHAHLHRYLAMCAETGFHNEARWPSGLAEIEIQERRRLFWQQYHFDVYLAVMFGSLVRQREAQCTVLYPAEVHDDEDILESGILPLSGDGVSFIRGWNFVTDLYRILEHVNERVRSRQMHEEDPSRAVSYLFSKAEITGGSPSAKEVLELVQRLYDGLPAQFKSAQPMTGDIIQDRHGFQAANIIISMMTVRMVLTGSEEHSVSQRCAIAGELLDQLSTMPTAYIQASSTAMLHHLAGVGHLLGSIIHAPLSQWMYLQVRSALLAMADLVGSLEVALSSAIGISLKLREHVQRIDQYMSDARRRGREHHVTHSALPTKVLDSALDPRAQADDQSRIDEMNNLNTYTESRQQLDFPLQLVPPTSTLSSDSLSQFQLPDDLLLDWPFNFGQGDAFDFFGLAQGGLGPLGEVSWQGAAEGSGLPFGPFGSQ